MRTSHLHTLVWHFLESIICNLEQKIWCGFQIKVPDAKLPQLAAKTRHFGASMDSALKSLLPRVCPTLISNFDEKDKGA